MFTLVHHFLMCLHMLSRLYQFSMFIRAWLPMFTQVWLMFTPVYSCLPMFTFRLSIFTNV